MAEVEVGEAGTPRSLLFLKAVRAPSRLSPRGSMRVLLAGIEDAHLFEATVAVVEASAAEVLGRADVAALDQAISLADMGFDSLACVELRRALWVRTGVEVPVEQILRGPTLRELAGRLLSDARLGPVDPVRS